MKTKLGSKFFTALVIFGFIGQVAWVVENMYFNVFIYKMFHASASAISIMVAASAVAATVTTILIGALSDRLGKRKIIICGGYLAWGISILAFAFIRMDILSTFTGSVSAAASLGITLVIVMDCVMTFFGSSANDAGYNAWITDWGNETNRGKIEGINSMMPLVAVLVVFGGFSAFSLDRPESWTMIYLIIGSAVMLVGLLGFILVEDKPMLFREENYWNTVIYSFCPRVMKSNPILYVTIVAFAIFGISIQTFMPYLILYYEKSLGMENYVFIMAPAILLASVVTVFYGKLFDRYGFKKSVIPSILILCSGYLLLYFGKTTIPVFIGSFFMMSGYLTGMAVFGAKIRNHIPEGKTGQFQGIRIIGQVLIPGVVGPFIGAMVLKNAEQIQNSDGTMSFLPNRNVFMAALVVAIILFVVLAFVFSMKSEKTERNSNK